MSENIETAGATKPAKASRPGVGNSDPIISLAAHEASATKAGGAASLHRFIAATLLLLSFRAERILNGANPFPPIEKWNADLVRAARVAHKAARGIDKAKLDADIKEAKGNVERAERLRMNHRNATNAADFTFDTAIALSALERAHGVQTMVDAERNKAAVPAAIFLPIGAADRKSHDEIMGDASPYQVMLQPTATASTVRIPYMPERLAAEYLAENKGKTKRAPWRDTCAVLDDISVSPKGVIAAYKDRVKALSDIAAARQAEANRSVPGPAGGAAPPVPAPGTAAPPASGGTAAPPASGTGPANGTAPANGTGPATATDQRAPQTPTVDLNAASSQIVPALTMARSAAMRDDGKVKFSAAVLEEWKALAGAVWRNPALHALFIAEREAAERAAKAENREQSKAV